MYIDMGLVVWSEVRYFQPNFNKVDKLNVAALDTNLEGLCNAFVKAKSINEGEPAVVEGDIANWRSSCVGIFDVSCKSNKWFIHMNDAIV